MLNTLLTLLTVISINDSIIDRAVQLFETRHLNSANLLTSADLLEQTLQSDPNNLRINYTLAQVYYTIGDHKEQKSERLENYYKGLNCSKKAMQLDNNCALAHFLYTACLGQISQLKGIFNSLASVGEVKKEIEIVLKLDPNNVMAYNAKAVIYYELPGILGGDVNKSILYLKKALAIDSNYSMVYVSLGKCYIRKKDYKTASSYLNQVLTLENGWPAADFVIDDKPEAIRLLKQIENK